MTDRAKKVEDFVNDIEKRLKNTQDFRHMSFTEHEDNFADSFNCIYDEVIEYFSKEERNNFAVQLGYNNGAELGNKVLELYEIVQDLIKLKFSIEHGKIWVYYMIDHLRGVPLSLNEIKTKGKNSFDLTREKAIELNQYYDKIELHITRNGLKEMYI